MSENKIKKAVIREDLLSITGDFRKAIILNQFIYWSERVSDADKFIEKENEIAKNNGEEEKELFYGWIYKNAEELAEEVMLGLSASQIRRYISDLVELGYISKRTNPKYKWDRTLQYRVNLVKIAKALKEKGYPLSDYKIDIPDDENSITHGRAINSEPGKNQTSVSEQAIPDTTTDITNRDYNTDTKEKGENINKVNEQVKTSVSEKKPMCAQKSAKQRYLDKKAEEFEMIKNILNICKSNYDEQIGSEIFKSLEYYFERYTQKTGRIHPILKVETLENIIEKMADYSDTEYQHFENIAKQDGAFIKIIDSFFDRDFGGVTGQRTNWNLPHFMSDGVIDRLTQKLWENGEVY